MSQPITNLMELLDFVHELVKQAQAAKAGQPVDLKMLKDKLLAAIADVNKVGEEVKDIDILEAKTLVLKIISIATEAIKLIGSLVG